ncbi:TetR/AcrR family transcriptional regulator [Kitasatospora sp. NPDC057965]|uniref:TetR/AcrR family transcriptional regulator n=1 Tax=Kitasatospora sp. NPDC057965 TaxID=3346291 RepID=UPI0036DE1357
MTAQSAALQDRRARLREETMAEILRTARKLLVNEGPNAVSLRAIAREMGMTAPSLYRYYGHHRDLVQALTATLYDDLAAHLIQARDQSEDSTPAGRFLASSRAMRDWILGHKAEFTLIFGKPVSDADCSPGDPCHEASWRFGGVFVGLMMEFWRAGTIPTPAPGTLDPQWLSQLEEVREHVGAEPPLEVLCVFVQAWARLFGMVSMEALGHLAFALSDPEPMFEHTLREILAMLHPAPAGAGSEFEAGVVTVPA